VGDPAVLAAAASQANGRVHDTSNGAGSLRRTTDLRSDDGVPRGA